MKGRCPRPLDEGDTLTETHGVYFSAQTLARRLGPGFTQCRPKATLFKIGAGNETRTRDPDLGKVVLYQLSYSRIWRPLGDSNPCYRRERAVS